MTSAAPIATAQARRRDAAATREALLAAGAELFAERGYDGRPGTAIAQRAGVNKAMINYHFRGKRKLYLAIVSVTFAETVAAVDKRARARQPAPGHQAAGRRGVGQAHPGPAHARAGRRRDAREAALMSAQRRRLAIVAALAILGLAGFAVWRFVLAPPALPPGVLAVSGRIEGDDSAVAAKTSGRIREMTVREGDRVEAGQVIAMLDDEQVRAREDQATAPVRQAEGRARLAPHPDAVLHQQLRHS